MTAPAPKTERPCADCGELFLTGPHARWCPHCRWKRRGRKPKKYAWTPERDTYLREHYDSRQKGRVAAIAARWGWPRWTIIRRAGELGLCVPHGADRNWTPEQEQFLLVHAGRRHVNWMAKQLGRTVPAVVLKLKRLHLSRRFREGYTLRELTLCFGTDHHVIERWVREEKLQIRKRGTDRARDAWYVTDADILRFIRDYPLTFELRKCDQVWFLDLLLAGGVIRKALGIAATDDEDLDQVDDGTADELPASAAG